MIVIQRDQHNHRLEFIFDKLKTGHGQKHAWFGEFIISADIKPDLFDAEHEVVSIDTTCNRYKWSTRDLWSVQEGGRVMIRNVQFMGEELSKNLRMVYSRIE